MISQGRVLAHAEHRPTVSFLVRLWLEPGEEGTPRGYVRDLRTGEEHYLGDPRRLGEHILRRLQGARQLGGASRDREEVEEVAG